jgi:hypothetical protein
MKPRSWLRAVLLTIVIFSCLWSYSAEQKRKKAALERMRTGADSQRDRVSEWDNWSYDEWTRFRRAAETQSP